MAIVALVENLWTGHGPSYFKVMMKVLCESGHDVWAFCPMPHEIREYAHINNMDPSKYQVFALSAMRDSIGADNKKENTLRPLSNWLSARSALQAASNVLGKKPNLVFFTRLDTMMGGIINHNIVDAIFPFKWSGLYIQATYLRYLHPRATIKIDWLNPHSLIKSKNCFLISVLDEGVIEKLSGLLKKRVIHFPDFTSEDIPSEKNEVYKKIIAAASGRQVVSILGVLHKKKGCLTLIDAAKRLPEEKFFFVFGGLAVDNVRENINLYMKEKQNALSLIDYIQNDEDFNAIVKASDIICAVYEDFRNSSNIMTKAALFKKPIIVSKGYLLEERVNKFNIGRAIPEANSVALENAIMQIVGNDEIKNEAQYDKYYQLNSIDMLKEKLCEVVDSSL